MKDDRLAVRARGLVKYYDDGAMQALDGVDLDVAHGEAVAITGRSGCGKSTLLYALSGLVRPDRGEIRIEGLVPGDADDWTDLRANTIGLIFQDAWLMPTLTVAENVEVPMMSLDTTPAYRRQRAMALLEAVGVAELATNKPAALSGGERQRVSVARSLVNAPKILLADEPTGALDSGNADQIMALLFRLCRTSDRALVIVSHDPAISERCDRSLVLVDGRGRCVAGRSPQPENSS